MRQKGVFDFLCRMLPAQRPVLLLGEPGCGKTAMAGAAAAAIHRWYDEFPMHLFDPPEVKGFPSKGDDGLCHWLPSALLPRRHPDTGRSVLGPGVLNLDELTQAPMAVQAPALQLCGRQRRVAEYVLPLDVAIMATGNRVEDRAGAFELGAALLDRFNVITVEANLHDWLEWARGAGVQPSIRHFLPFKSDLLQKFDPNAPGNGKSPTCRGWEEVSLSLPLVSRSQLHEMVAGYVGTAAATEFEAFLQLDLPSMEELIADPDHAPILTAPGANFALTGMFADRLRGQGGEALLDPVARYVTRWERIMALHAIRECTLARPAFMLNPATARWARENPALLAA